MSQYQAPSLERALAILEYLSQRGEPVALADLARALDYPKNSVFRIMRTLHAQGYLLYDEQAKTYCLSHKLFSLGYSAVADRSLLESSFEAMRELRDLTRETVLLGALHGNAGVVLELMPSLHPVKFLVDVGTQFPLHTAAPAKAILAWLPAKSRARLLDEVELLRYTERTIISRAALEEHLEAVRECGFAVDEAEEIEGVHCVAAPVFDHCGRAAAALWVTGPSARMEAARFPELGTMVGIKARQISQRLGWDGARVHGAYEVGSQAVGADA
jgi:DNA-binding IclR family transcriptional regulator